MARELKGKYEIRVHQDDKCEHVVVSVTCDGTFIHCPLDDAAAAGLSEMIRCCRAANTMGLKLVPKG